MLPPGQKRRIDCRVVPFGTRHSGFLTNGAPGAGPAGRIS